MSQAVSELSSNRGSAGARRPQRNLSCLAGSEDVGTGVEEVRITVPAVTSVSAAPHALFIVMATEQKMLKWRATLA